MISLKRVTPLVAAALILEGAAFAQDAGTVFSSFQFHGNLTQGFLYSSGNNYLSTGSRDGSAKWTEGTLSAIRPITDQIRAGVQAHSYSLGQLGRQRVTLDWAYGDCKASPYFGVRAGKVKTPGGLFNDVQDVDGLHPWVFLPQSLYPSDLRGFNLAHTGGVVYGDIGSATLGSIQYQAFGGVRSQSRIEGFSTLMAESGIGLRHCSGPSAGIDIRWLLPVSGLSIGSTYASSRQSAPDATMSGMAMPVEVSYAQPQFYARFEREKLDLVAEWKIGSVTTKIGPAPENHGPPAWHM